MRYLLAILLITACGRSDNDFAPYVEEFRREAAARGLSVKDIPVVIGAYGEVPPKAMAMCESYNGEPSRVVIAQNWWDYYANRDIGRKFIVFHELGHCALAREHTNDRDSIMNEKWAQRLDNYESRWVELVDELFKGG
jgi:hypothetical protein